MSTAKRSYRRRLLLAVVVPGAAGAVVVGVVTSVVLELILVPELSAHLSERRLGQLLFTVNLTLAAVSTLAVLGLLGLAQWVAREAARPLEELQQRAAVILRQVAPGAAQRVPAPGWDQELGVLKHTLETAAEALHEQKQQRERLIQDLAHELKTPLTGVRAYLEALGDGVLPLTTENTDAIKRELDRLERLAGDLRLLVSADAKQLELAPRPLEYLALVQDTLRMYVAEAAKRQLVLTADLPSPPLRVNGDPDRLQQVLHNLLNNALQYTPPGGTVTVAVRRTAGWVRTTVSNTGVQLPAEAVARVFDRFYRVDPSRAAASGGRGLGLSIAKELVEAHGGTISLASDASGVAVTVRLPVFRGRREA